MKAETRRRLLLDLREEITELRKQHPSSPIRAAIACGQRENVADYSWVEKMGAGSVVFSANMSDRLIGGAVHVSEFAQLQRIAVFQQGDDEHSAIHSLIELLRRHQIAFSEELPENDHPLLHWWVERVIHSVHHAEFRPLEAMAKNIMITRHGVEGSAGMAVSGVDDLLTASAQYLALLCGNETSSDDWELIRPSKPSLQQLAELTKLAEKSAKTKVTTNAHKTLPFGLTNLSGTKTLSRYCAALGRIRSTTIDNEDQWALADALMKGQGNISPLQAHNMFPEKNLRENTLRRLKEKLQSIGLTIKRWSIVEA